MINSPNAARRYVSSWTVLYVRPAGARDKAARLASGIMGHQSNEEIVAVGTHILRDIDLTPTRLVYAYPQTKVK